MDFPNLDEFNQTSIQFHLAEIDYSLPDEEVITAWIEATIHAEGKELQTLNFIFCNDAYLHKINVEYLQHDTLTDVITFPYAAPEAPIEGDIYISLDRIQENANIFQISFLQELKRVMIHGVLHLCGYGDKTSEEQKIMRIKENFYLEKEKGMS